MEDENADPIYTLDQAVQFLGTSRPTLYRLLSQGSLKGLKVGRQWRFRKADLVAYMERGPVAVAAAPADVLDGELALLAEHLRQAGQESTGIPPNDAGPGEADEPERKTIQLAHDIIRLALIQRASDIHLEPARLDGSNVSLLRLRVDGVLHEVRRLAFTVHESLIARFKIMAEVDVSERRLPQDGRIPVRWEGRNFDIRVSVVPTLYGEAIAMRILDRSSVGLILGLDKTNLSTDEQAQLRGWMQRPNGLLLFTGPLGSGKTTTAISAIQDKARPEIKTMTLEEPVEIALPYTTQMQINTKAGLAYAAGLRAILRQDPDIVYVSALPDLEAAGLAVQMALAGHLVLSALSTNDAPAALSHLADMGLEPHLVAATVIGVVAQRLCRNVCPHCKVPYQMPASDLVRFGLEPDDPNQTLTLYRGAGCDRCRQRGYLGRTAIFEMLEMTEEIADLIVARAPQPDIVAAAQAGGMTTLRQAGLLRVLDGITTPEEVLRVTAGAG